MDIISESKSDICDIYYGTEISTVIRVNIQNRVLRKELIPQKNDNDVSKNYGVNFKEEIKIMKLINESGESDFFPKLLATDYSFSDDIYYIFMTYYHNHVDIFSYVIDEKEKLTTIHIKKMIGAVDYLHSLNIIHGDIKLENFLVYKDDIKLIDFGFSVVYKEKENKLAGTFAYCAPEQMYNMVLCHFYISNGFPLDEEVFGNELYEYDFTSDIYSLGVTIYCGLYLTNSFTKSQEYILQYINNVFINNKDYDNFLIEFNKIIKLKPETPEYIKDMMKLYKKDRPKLSNIINYYNL